MTTVAKKDVGNIPVKTRGFIPPRHDKTMPLCPIRMTTLSHESMRSCKLRNHLQTMTRRENHEIIFKNLRDNFQIKTTVKQMFSERSTKADKGLLCI